MANPSYPRARRLAETIKRLVSEWLEFEQAEHLAGFVTVTDVRVTPDLRHAKAFFTVLGDEAQQAATAEALAAAAGRARAHVARHVRLRYAPTLEFVADDVPGRGARIDQLLAELDRPPADAPDDVPAAGPGPEQERSRS